MLLLSAVILTVLFLISDGTLRIVDYKTGVPPEAGEPAPGYIYQLALYQKAAAELWQRPVTLAELHFLQK